MEFNVSTFLKVGISAVVFIIILKWILKLAHQPDLANLF
jgi:hypothetical protein